MATYIKAELPDGGFRFDIEMRGKVVGLDDAVVDGVGDGFGDVADVELFVDAFTVEGYSVGRFVHQ